MANAKNKVLAGDYGKWTVSTTFGGKVKLTPSIVTSVVNAISEIPAQENDVKAVFLDNTTVSSYEVVTARNWKSLSSGLLRGVAGATVMRGLTASKTGSSALQAGFATAKRKGIYQVVINFADGKRSLLEVDEKLHNAIMVRCF